MSSQSQAVAELPVKTLEGADKVLEVYPDRVIVRRTDMSPKILTSLHRDTQTIDLHGIREVYLLNAKYAYSRWLMLIVLLVNHKHIPVLYKRNNFAQAQAVKDTIDNFIMKREQSPPAQV